MTLPTITDADRAAGFKDLVVRLRGSGKETVRVFKPEPVKMLEILRLPSACARVYLLNAHALRKEVSDLQNLHSSATCEIYFAAVGLNSQEAFDMTLAHSQEIGALMIAESSKNSNN